MALSTGKLIYGVLIFYFILINNAIIGKSVYAINQLDVEKEIS
jgi:hypothetical protein